ncbi:MAG: hypothetical protein PGN37_20450 [Mycobacterium kyogaense]|uniref:hypothetical protein n=1 Tax=Mycobacterium kyogaense TaxID=2212479 RepID=UPI002FFA9AB9
MPDQDAVEDKALAAAHAVSQQVGALWLQAHADGMRNGMEAGALHVDVAVQGARQLDMPTDFVEFLESLRDQIRLYALQIPDTADGTGS